MSASCILCISILVSVVSKFANHMVFCYLIVPSRLLASLCDLFNKMFRNDELDKNKNMSESSSEELIRLEG